MTLAVSKLNIKLLDNSISHLYTKDNNHKFDGGLNIFVSEDILIKPHETRLVKTGIACSLHNVDTTYYLLAPRSSIYKTPLIQHNSIGIIDAGYTGEIKIPFHNLSNNPFFIQKESSFNQLLHPLGKKWEIEIVDELNKKDGRGIDGFGSTNL